MAASSKRARVDETERTDVPLNPSLPVVLVAPEQLHAHRSLLRGRATLANAADSLMAISCDGWTSSNQIAFLAIVGSWITEDWRLEEVLLDFVELHGAHTGENMSIAVASALTELGIKDKLLALVGDNASTNGTLLHHLSASLGQSSSKLRWDPEKGQICCLAHIIHLAVMTLLRSIKAVPTSTDMHDFDPKDLQLTPEEAESFVAINNTKALEDDLNTKLDSLVDLTSAIDKITYTNRHRWRPRIRQGIKLRSDDATVVSRTEDRHPSDEGRDKIRKISKLVRSSPQRMELFTATATQIEEWHEQKSWDETRSYKRKAVKNLILDVATRWNSVFLMIEQALEFSKAIDALVNHPKITLYRPYGLSRSEWTAVAQVGKWLKCVDYDVYFLLISYVMDLETGSAVVNSPSLAAGITACKEKLLEFFDKATYL
ncbi:AC9 transposase [Ceratobasidium sp. AG-Ba]|nr:AC9 transposase [Ceratobasidium sp. AG-Ba]